ncbi:MAG: hypothetical protein ACYSWZ_09510 [Planctomycetota bacterium]|jgi:hypothetical protein
MNRKQEIILWVGLIIIQLMIVFPPVGRPDVFTVSTDGAPGRPVVIVSTQHYGVITRDYKNIRFFMLAAQLLVVAAVTGGFVYAYRITGQEEDGH